MCNSNVCVCVLQERLKALTDIVWPEIAHLVKTRIGQAGEEGDASSCRRLLSFVAFSKQTNKQTKKASGNSVFFAGKQVCVVDAAVLLEAGWMDMVHEVWVTIIPDEEVGGFFHVMGVSFPDMVTRWHQS